MTLVTFVEYWIFLWACWPPGDAEVDILESAPLEMEGEACLEFWYRAPFAAEGSELRALVKSSTRLVEIWTSPALPGDSWRQVFIPLNIIEPETKVKWHICNHKVRTSPHSCLWTAEPFEDALFIPNHDTIAFRFLSIPSLFPVFSWKHVASIKFTISTYLIWIYCLCTVF